MLDTPFDVFSAFVISVLGLVLVWISADKASISKHRASLLYAWHGVFAYAYANFVYSNGGDALWYYQSATADLTEWSLGNAAIIKFTELWAYWIGLSFLSTSLIFHSLGTIGLVYFDGALKTAIANKVKWTKTVASVVVFLPSASFWTSGLGKDSVTIFGLGLLLWSNQEFQKRVVSAILALTVVFLVRPHIGFVLVGCFAFSVLFARRSRFWFKAGLAVISMTALFVLMPLVTEMLGISDFSSASELGEYVTNRQNANLDGGSSVNITNLSVPMRLFSYMFRPLFFDGGGGSVLVASAENALLLFAFVGAFFGMVFKYGESKENLTFLSSYVFVTWLLLANTTSNLGIAARQKWMILPALIILLLSLQQNLTNSRNHVKDKHISRKVFR